MNLRRACRRPRSLSGVSIVIDFTSSLGLNGFLDGGAMVWQVRSYMPLSERLGRIELPSTPMPDRVGLPLSGRNRGQLACGLNCKLVFIFAT